MRESKEKIDAANASLSGPLWPGSDKSWPEPPPEIDRTIHHLIAVTSRAANALHAFADSRAEQERATARAARDTARRQVAIQERRAAEHPAHEPEHRAAVAELTGAQRELDRLERAHRRAWREAMSAMEGLRPPLAPS